MEGNGNGSGEVDLDATMTTLGPEDDTSQGLILTNKQRVMYRPPAGKSVLGLDTLADKKRAAGGGSVFRPPPPKVAVAAGSIDEDEKPGATENDAASLSTAIRSNSSRRYRGSGSDDKTSLNEPTVTDKDERAPTPSHRDEPHRQETHISGSSQGSRPHGTPRGYDYYDDRGSCDKHGDHERSASIGYSSSGRRRYHDDRESHTRRDERGRSISIEYTNKRSRHEHSSRSSRTPARSDWDDGRWEWEDAPRRDYRDNRPGSRRQSSTRSPMLAAASPDARLVSPWLGGNTPRSAASPWDNVSPSPAPIRASGSSKGSSYSHSSGRSHQLTFTSTTSSNVIDADRSPSNPDRNYEITEEMMQEMDYNADRAWYDCEEHTTMFDGDNSMYHGDDNSYKKKEAEMPKKLTRRDGSLMTLAQSKKLSQMTADNAQWEDRQLLRSGAVKGTEVQTEFDDEEERKVILLVHDTKPPFLDGRVVFTKQAEPVMPLKDPTSDMAIIARKGSSLVREIREKQSMNKSRQRFWELAGSKLGNILGVEKTAEQVDADTAVVGDQGEINFKEEAKFSQHLKDKAEAVSDFAKSKSLSQQRQYLPIFTVRDDLLQDKMDLAPQGLITLQQKANDRRPVGSSQIWTRYGVLLPSQQTRKLKEWVLTDEQQQLVNASGLGHLALTTGFTIDRTLLTSFCERWNNETNTAHFMGFEMAPSLRDVSYILGIPVTGHVVTAEPIGDEAVKRMCLHYLGESPGNGEQLCGLIRLTWLYRNFHQLPENPTINDIAYSTRAYLLYLVGSTLFPDTMRGFVSPRYLPLLGDFRKIREYAWGAAALAHLYRGLSVAVTPNATTQFLGSATLLMAWIYEYLPITQPQQKNQSTLLPRACRWNFGGATRGQRKKVMEWRKVFEQLQFSEVNWNPYKDINPAIVPEYCIAADNICYSRTWLISFNIKEVYVPDRFARQFGREQGRLHGVPMWARRTWSKWKDWRAEYAREIEEFHQLVGCRFTPPAETNINSLPLHESSAGQNDAGCSLNTSHNFSTMVEDLKNDLPVIGRYLEGNLLPSEVSSFLERVGTMIKSYSPPQSSRRKDRVAHGHTGPVKSKNPRKGGKPSLFQDPLSPHRYPGTPVPYQASKCGMVFGGTVPLLNGGEALKEQEAMDPWQISQSHLTMTTSSSSLDSSSPESMKRSREGGDEIQIPRDTDCLRRSGRLCVQLKMFKHRDGVGAEAANPIFL